MGKVFRNGNSLAVTVPKAIAHSLQIRQGSYVEWKDSKEGTFLVAEKKTKKVNEVDAKFMKMVDKFVNRHSDVLRELAKR